MPEAKPTEDAPVRVAKISAVQAVVVAIITAAAGVLAGYIGKSSNQAPPQQQLQRWIVIDGAESRDYSVVRIVATINGVHFSYPSNSVWAEVGPSMSRERFPVPSADRYTVSFRAFLSNPGPSATLSGEANYVETISEVPSGERTYSLYPVNSGYRGAKPVLQVRYHVE